MLSCDAAGSRHALRTRQLCCARRWLKAVSRFADPADRPTQVFDRHRRERRGNIGREEIDEPLDRVVTEPAEEPALPDETEARREDLRQERFGCGRRCGASSERGPPRTEDEQKANMIR